MIINGRSVRGLYLYSEDETFERGDFVAKGDKLYRCKVTVRGEDPDLDYNETYYVSYLSEDTINVDEFKAYLSGDEDFGDKFISLNSLSFILGSYMSGFDEKGLISNSIIEDDNVYKIIAENYFDGNETYLNPLDTILTSGPNNGIFTVAKDIVQDIIGLVPEDSDDIMLLRQYTYSNSTNNYLTRIQELIDVTTGTVKYRYASSTNNFEPNVNWLDVSINPEFKKIVDEVINHYQNLINDLKSTKISLLSNFRFKSIPVERNCSSKTILLDGDDADIVFNPIEDTTLEFTITLEQSSSSIISSDSITVCIKDFDETESIYSVFGGNVTLKVKANHNQVQIDITKVKSQDLSSYTISSIYYKDVYKNTLGVSSGEKSNYLINTNVEQSINPDGDVVIIDPEKGLLGVTIELKSFAWLKDEMNSGAVGYAIFIETESVSGKIMIDLDEMPKDREIILSYYNYLKKEEDGSNDSSYPNESEISKLRIWVWRNSRNNTITIGAANKNPDINNREDIVGTIDITYDRNARTIEGYSLQYYLDNYRNNCKQKIKKITYYG